jgi:hypothetical protein
MAFRVFIREKKRAVWGSRGGGGSRVGVRLQDKETMSHVLLCLLLHKIFESDLHHYSVYKFCGFEYQRYRFPNSYTDPLNYRLVDQDLDQKVLVLHTEQMLC